MTLRKPPLWFRGLVVIAQGVFYNFFCTCIVTMVRITHKLTCNVVFSYLISPKLCHRFVGYLEEEAIVT